MAHAERRFAQIYSVPLTQGEPTVMSSGAGCHISPSVSKSGELMLVHAACFNRGRNFEIQKHSQPTKIVVGDGSIRDLRLSSDSTRFAYAHTYGPYALVAVKNTETAQVTMDVSLPGFEEHPQPQFGAPLTSVYFLYRHHIWVTNGSESKEVVNLGETK
jgi:hypothetical protein